MKCELVKVSKEDEYDVLFEGTIDCEPDECQVIMHKGQAFVYIGAEEGDVVSYTLTKVAEFTEDKD